MKMLKYFLVLPILAAALFVTGATHSSSADTISAVNDHEVNFQKNTNYSLSQNFSSENASFERTNNPWGISQESENMNRVNESVNLNFNQSISFHQRDFQSFNENFNDCGCFARW